MLNDFYNETPDERERRVCQALAAFWYALEDVGPEAVVEDANRHKPNWNSLARLLNTAMGAASPKEDRR